MKSFLKYWLPLLIWLGVIFVGSTSLMSAEHTSRYVVPFLLWLKPGMSPRTIWIILVVARKCAHVSEYAILALLLFRAVVSAANLKWSMWILSVSVWIACVFVATSDEFHQSFIASRTASLNDVFTDSLGAAISLAICLAIAQRDAKKLDEPTGKS